MGRMDADLLQHRGLFRHLCLCPGDAVDRPPPDVRHLLHDRHGRYGLGLRLHERDAPRPLDGGVDGRAQLSVFGGYAIYFPELFPTRLRSTGTSFCYNVGRYVSAIGPLGLAVLKPSLVKYFGDQVLAFRWAGVVMCSCFLVGLVALLLRRRPKGSRCRNKPYFPVACDGAASSPPTVGTTQTLTSVSISRARWILTV